MRGGAGVGDDLGRGGLEPVAGALGARLHHSIELLAVSGISRNDIWVVGVTATGAFAERQSLYWNGRRSIDVPAGDYSNPTGVAYDPAGFWWSVGHDHGQSVIQRIAVP